LKANRIIYYTSARKSTGKGLPEFYRIIRRVIITFQGIAIVKIAL
jgi:hypothetical protein